MPAQASPSPGSMGERRTFSFWSHLLNAPSVDVKDILDGISSLSLAFAVDLFINERPSTPDECVTIYDSGGFDSQPNDLERPTVQIVVRGTKNGFQTAYALAKAIRNELHEYVNTTVNSTRYIQIMAQGAILSIGKDDNGRPLFSMNFRIERT